MLFHHGVGTPPVARKPYRPLLIGSVGEMQWSAPRAYSSTALAVRQRTSPGSQDRHLKADPHHPVADRIISNVRQGTARAGSNQLTLCLSH